RVGPVVDRQRDERAVGLDEPKDAARATAKPSECPAGLVEQHEAEQNRERYNDRSQNMHLPRSPSNGIRDQLLHALRAPFDPFAHKANTLSRHAVNRACSAFIASPFKALQPREES